MAQNRAHPTVFGCSGEYLGALTGGEGGFEPTVRLPVQRFSSSMILFPL